MKKFFLVALTSFVFHQGVFSQTAVDILITNGLVYDGTLSKPKKVDIGVKNDRIVFVGDGKKANLKPAKYINAEGNIVSPGFIDPHTHIESNLNSTSEEKRAALIWLRQGVTTVITGNDGYGRTNTGELFDKWDNNGIGVNAAMYVGFGPVRNAVLGNRNVEVTSYDIEKMKMLVEKSMQEGAIGLSTGLSYQPQNFSKTAEISELAKVAAKYNGIYDTHMRGQGWPSTKHSIAEVLEIERASGIKVHISHIKVGPKSAFGRSADAIAILDSARKAGSSIDANVYPFLASSDALSGMVPRWAREQGHAKLKENLENPEILAKIMKHLTKDLENLGGGKGKQLVARSNELSYLTGKTVADMAIEWQISEEETVVKLLKMQPNMGCLTFGQNESDMLNFLKKPYIVVGSDGGETHPRGAGSFAKAIGEYTIEKKLMPLEEMIHKSTGLTAKIFNLKDRGVIKEGAFADIVILHPAKFKANATYTNPAELATGVNAVLVNGQLVVENDVYLKKLAGKALRYNKQ